MSDLVALKVKIGLRANGQADHPDFNQIRANIRKNMDWSKYIDRYGSGWLYDNCCGHQEQDETSPRGIQYGIILVPKDFAEAALEKFGHLCTVCDEVECERFYNERHSVRMPEYDIDEKHLNEIKQIEELEASGALEAPSEEEKTRRRKVRDPKDDTRGIRANKRKKWATRKQLTGWTVIDPSLVKKRK